MAGKEIRAGKAFVEILLRNNLQAGLKRAAKQLRAFATLTSTIGVGLSGASAAILGPIGAAVQQFSEVGESVKKMALRTGMSTEAISELSHAASVSGTDLDAMEAGMRKMHDTVIDAARGGQQARDALSRLGLSARPAGTCRPTSGSVPLPIGSWLSAARRSVRRWPWTCSARPASRSSRCFPVERPAWLPCVSRLGRSAFRCPVIPSKPQANSTTLLGLVWQSVKGLTLNIGAAMAPTVSDLAERITSVISFVTRFVQKNQQLVVSVAATAAAIGAAGMAFFALSGMSAAAAVAASGLASAVGIVASVRGRDQCHASRRLCRR